MRHRLMIPTLFAACTLASVGLVIPAASAQPMRSAAQEEEREELARILEQRASALERRAEQMLEQAGAIRAGAPLEEIRGSLRQRAPEDAEDPQRDRPPTEGRGAERGRHGGTHPDDSRVDVSTLTPQLVERIFETMREDRPGMAKRLDALRESDPEEHARVRERLLRMFVERAGGDGDGVTLMLEVRRSERDIRDIAKRIRENPEQRETLEPELRDALQRTAGALVAVERHAIERQRAAANLREQRLEENLERRETLIEERLTLILEGRDPREGGRRSGEEGERPTRGRGDERPPQRDRPTRD